MSNIRFAAQATDYLQAELDLSPLLHFWSLGVEEQFYLFWPALLFLVAGRRLDIRRIGLVVAVVAVLSFVLGRVDGDHAPLAFFLLPARACSRSGRGWRSGSRRSSACQGRWPPGPWRSA